MRGPAFIKRQSKSFFKNVLGWNFLIVTFGFYDSLEEPKKFGLGHEPINIRTTMNDVKEPEILLPVLKAGNQ